MQYRKKPLPVDAWRVSELNYAAEHDWLALPKAVRDAYEKGGWVFGALKDDNTRSIFLPTLEGTMEARHNDWIIKGLVGEFYPCKPDAFAAGFEAVV